MPVPSPLPDAEPLGVRLARQRPDVLRGLADRALQGVAAGQAVASLVALEIASVAELVAGCDLDALVSDLRAASARRRLGFVAGRLCAELALREASGALGRVGRDVDGAPAWPPGWCGSIAHDHRLAIAVVAPRASARSLGIDVERRVDASARAAIEQVCSTPAEQRAIEASAAPEDLATLVFSAKEAYYKAVFPTIRSFVDFHEVQVAHVDWAGQRFLVQPCTPRLFDGVALPALHGRFQWLGDDLVTQVTDPGPATRA